MLFATIFEKVKSTLDYAMDDKIMPWGSIFFSNNMYKMKKDRDSKLHYVLCEYNEVVFDMILNP